MRKDKASSRSIAKLFKNAKVGGDQDITEKKHWHYMLDFEIAVPKKLTHMQAEQLLESKIVAFIEDTLNGAAQCYSSKWEACSKPRRLGAHCATIARLDKSIKADEKKERKVLREAQPSTSAVQ
jgi:hypothetical protein